MLSFKRAGFFSDICFGVSGRERIGSDIGAFFMMEQRLTAVAVRIRRSLKPKRMVLTSRALEIILEKFVALQLGCPRSWTTGDRSRSMDPTRRRPSQLARRSQCFRGLTEETGLLVHGDDQTVLGHGRRVFWL